MKSQPNLPQSHVRAQYRCAPACPDVILSRRSSAFRTVRWPALVLGAAFILSPIRANQPPTPPDAPPIPILVELFTSEGCSSCPPVDEFVRHIDETQPVPGAQLIVLSEHVDYWDHDGWKDKYSSAQFTDRQNGYVHALNLQTAYTPQMIVDGYLELKGSSADIEQTFAKELKVAKIPVRIASAKIDSPGQLKVKVEADAPEKHGGTVWVAVALDHAASQVSAGENSGKQLQHVAVVEELRKVGKLDKGKPFSQDVAVKLKPDTDPKNLRIIAFIQESNEGKVLGATGVKVSNP